MYKYSDEDLIESVKVSTSYCGVLRELKFDKMNGSSHAHIRKRITALGLDVSHFTGRGHNKGKVSNDRLASDKVLVYEPDRFTRRKCHQLRWALEDVQRDVRCVGCGIGEIYNNKFIRLHIDHIDGNWRNNNADNLRFLCPNCHSQTDTFGCKNSKLHLKQHKQHKQNKQERRPRASKLDGICKEELIVLTQKMSVEDAAESLKISVSYFKRFCSSLNVKIGRKVKLRIAEDELRRLVNDNVPFTKIAEMYNVSDNAIRKRCKKWNIKYKRRSKGYRSNEE